MANKFEGMNVHKTTGAGGGEEVLKRQRQGASRRGQQQLVTPSEKAEREASGHTQGRKGCKSPRINTAIWSENYEFITIMARVTGMTLSEYINRLIAQYRTEHSELYEQAKAMRANLGIDSEEYSQ